MKYPFLSDMDMALVDGPMSYLRMFYKKIEHRVYSRNPQPIQLSIGDYMLLRDTLSHLQFCISSLCIDVDNYLQKGDRSFHYQTTCKQKIYGSDYDASFDNQRFIETIDSIITNGYSPNSVVELDADITLTNGTHRTAILLCINQYEIGGLRFNYRWKRFHDFNHYVSYYDFDKKYVDDVLTKYKWIENKLVSIGSTFALYLSKDSRINDMFISDKIILLNTIELANDRIFYQFAFVKPDYRIKGDRIISRAAERFEQQLIKMDIRDMCVAKNCTEGMKMYNNYVLNRDSNNV